MASEKGALALLAGAESGYKNPDYDKTSGMIPLAGLEPRSLALLFPPYSEAELTKLACDIRDQGLLEPIAMYQEKVLDGWNRVLACRQAGIDQDFVVIADPHIKIGLQLVDGTVHLFAERDAIKLIEHGLVEALADTVGLRALRLGARVIDVLDREIELILVRGRWSIIGKLLLI